MSDAISLPDVQLTPESLAPTQTDARDQFLRLHLASDLTVLLPVQQLTEVLNLPVTQIVPMPHMPAWVMGIYNWRGEILWMVDLGHLCGLSPWYKQAKNSSQHSAVVLQISSSVAAPHRTLGLVVDRVEDIEWFDPATIQPVAAAAIGFELASLLMGYWQNSDGELLAVLSGEAIVAAMPKS